MNTLQTDTKKIKGLLKIFGFNFKTKHKVSNADGVNTNGEFVFEVDYYNPKFEKCIFDIKISYHNSYTYVGYIVHFSTLYVRPNFGFNRFEEPTTIEDTLRAICFIAHNLRYL